MRGLPSLPLPALTGASSPGPAALPSPTRRAAGPAPGAGPTRGRARRAPRGGGGTTRGVRPPLRCTGPLGAAGGGGDTPVGSSGTGGSLRLWGASLLSPGLSLLPPWRCCALGRVLLWALLPPGLVPVAPRGSSALGRDLGCPFCPQGQSLLPRGCDSLSGSTRGVPSVPRAGACHLCGVIVSLGGC